MPGDSSGLMKKLMWNYREILEFLALKRVVIEKLRDYLLGPKFSVYTDNNLLAYRKEIELGVA